MKIAVFVGTRAELIKVFPLLKRIKNSDHKLVFIHTGQHSIERLCKLLEVPQPDEVLSPVPDESSKFKGSVVRAIKWNLMLLTDIRSIVKRESPDIVAYHGDTMSTSLTALGASRFFFPFRSFKTAHIESGLRSGSIFEPFPEELSRIISDTLSNILFAVSSRSEDNLKWHKLLQKSVYNVGNTIVDSAQEAEEIGEPYERQDYGLVTIHRHETIKSEKRLNAIISILEGAPRDLIFPLHDNTRAALEKHGLMERLESIEGVEITNLVDYPDFINMIKNADILYTDGGSIQEESFIYKVPCIILRKRTERKEGVEEELNYLSKFDVSATVDKAEELIEKDFTNCSNPYGNRGSVDRIMDKLEKESMNQ